MVPKTFRLLSGEARFFNQQLPHITSHTTQPTQHDRGPTPYIDALLIWLARPVFGRSSVFEFESRRTADLPAHYRTTKIVGVTHASSLLHNSAPSESVLDRGGHSLLSSTL